MGILSETTHSRITNGIEHLQTRDVTAIHWKRLQDDSSYADLIAAAFRGETSSTEVVRQILEGESLVVTATDGTETLASARDVFTGYVDANFVNWKLDQSSMPTSNQSVAVYEMQADANFAGMFGSFGVDTRTLVLTQAQIKRFCRDHRAKLRKEGYATFFLFEADTTKGHELFVAGVLVDGGRLKVHVFRFDYSYVWVGDDRRRLVVPQLPSPPALATAPAGA